MAVKSGTVILLKLNTSVVDATTSADINIAADKINTTTKDSTGTAKEHLRGETEISIDLAGKWSESGSHFSIEYLIDAALAGTVLPFVWGDTATGALTLSGNCTIGSFKASAPQNAEATWSATLESTGPVTRGTAA